MKRLTLSLILSLFVFFAYAGGISNYKELLAFAKAANAGADITAWQDDKGVVCLTADIDMKKGKKFPTIELFNGVFDGGGHKLYNWNTKNALFNKLETKGIVRNVIIDSSCHLKVVTSMNTADESCAFLVLYNRGQVINCENRGAVEFTGDECQKAISVGGLVAVNANIVYKCKNAGDVSSRISYTHHKKGADLRMGGVVGFSIYKAIAGATISRCENTGNVTYMGDYLHALVGGITGYAGRATVKYCVNRGQVIAVGTHIANPKIKANTRAAGIAAWSNSDLICCDNFGVVAVSGEHISFAAGIVGRLNAASNITNCYNYGKISTNTSNLGHVGGIIAHSVRNIHISHCYNYGEILSEGSSKQSYCAGIAAAMSIQKNIKTESFIRDCANYAAITNKVANKWAATAGIIAYATGYSNDDRQVNLIIHDCGNFGEVSHASPGPRVGQIVGHQKYVTVKGEYYDDFAKPMKTLADGTNIFGRVTDTEGNPVEGAVVSAGSQSVKTNVKGEYSIKTPMDDVRFVVLSLPAAYEMPLRDQRPQFFRRVPRYTEAVRADFVLKRREKVSDNFVLAMIGDPQVRGSKIDTSVDRFRDVILPDLKEFVGKTDKEVYAICLGDLVYNYMSGFDDYVDAIAEFPVPMVSVIGNHDYDQRTIFETKLGTPYFESYLAPLNYSFNIGKMHFVVVNNILYNRPSNKHHYKTGMEDYTLEWLENDLKHVPTETTIVICGHSPLFKWRTSYNDKSVNYKRYSALLAKYDKVYAWAGHTHQNYHYNYAGGSGKHASLKNLERIVGARCIGMIRSNRELYVDGTPNGYMVADVQGDKMEWYYKSVGKDRDCQIRAYSPSRTASEYVKAVVWNHSPESWSNPEWWENGVKVADMEYSKNEYDPDYVAIHEQLLQQKMSKSDRRFVLPRKMPFFFRVNPSAGVRSGEIRVTDNFGVTYTQKVEW